MIVTTEEARAYGINATTGAIKWSRSFGTPVQGLDHRLLGPEARHRLHLDAGDRPATGIVYLTTRLETGSGGLANAHWYLQAVSASTGEEASGFPVEITGTPVQHARSPLQREPTRSNGPALLLLDGIVYVAFASDCDITPYRGIVVGVSTTTHAITTMWSDESGVGTDQNSQAGIWQSGGGLVSDEPATGSS